MSNKCLQCSSVFIASKETSNINFCPDGFDAEFLKFPNPKYCSKCRRQQRMAFYNERQLYKRQSDLSGKDIISVYSPNKPFKVYAPEEWWGDSWDPIANGIEYDPNRSFFAQLGALMRLVPKQSLIISNCENSDYNNKIANSKNCYLVFDSIYCEDSFYTTASYNVKDSLDIWWSKDIELSAYIFSSTNLYNCLHCMNSTNSSDLIFCRHMANSKNCFGCVNLSDAEFRIFNVQYTEEEYNKHIELFNRGSYKQIKSLLKQVEEFYLNMPYPACDMNRNENCSGDFIYNSKNCNNCFTTVESEDCSFVFEGGRNFNSQDLYAVYDCSGLVYQAVNSTGLYNSAFIIESHNCSDSFYLMNCYQTKNSFGCVGTRNAEYCILNKQYNKDDYLTICKKIIEQFKESGTWGDFFPKKLSAFGYNETTAQLYFPLNKDQALSIGAWWEDYEKANKATAKTIKSSELPDHIDQIDLSLSEQTIICEDTNLPFRLSKPEIHLYKKFKLPIPRKHPNQRHLEMLKWRNQPDLYTRTCINCNKETPSSFSPERKEIVYCQDCFFNEVYT